MTRKLVITYPDCEFDHRYLNYHKGVEDILLLPGLLGDAMDEDFVKRIENAILDKGINEISLEMTTGSRKNVADPVGAVQEILLKELRALNGLEVVSGHRETGKLKTSAFVYDNETAFFAAVEEPAVR